METSHQIAAQIIRDYEAKRKVRDGDNPAEDFLELDIVEAIKAEREACAQIVAEVSDFYISQSSPSEYGWGDIACNEIGEKIRARS